MLTPNEEKILKFIVVASENDPNNPEFPPDNPKFPATPTVKIAELAMLLQMKNILPKDKKMLVVNTGKTKIS